MDNKAMGPMLKILVAASYLVMVLVNGLAVYLPINGIDTGAVSDSYPNLFAPAGSTFAIWGLIYLLLAASVLYQTVFDKRPAGSELPYKKIGTIFFISSLVNAAWIFAWHYLQFPLTVLLMLALLICLILINRETAKAALSKREVMFMQLPFSIYFGWITVATIANVTVLLVSLGWKGAGIPETVWTMAVLGVGILIGIAVMFKNRDAAYGLVLIWAYAGILNKHILPEGFNGQHLAVIYAVILCLGLLVLAEAYLIFGKKIKPR
jgi:vacuolar-type H+-ATPase subunit I/STV1